MTEQEIESLLDPDFHRTASERVAEFCEFFACPECGAVAFFPHGSDIDEGDLRRVARWLCKQCGYYIGPEGEAWALYDPLVDLTDTPLKVWGCWQLEKDASAASYLPRDVIAAAGEQARRQAGVG